MVQVQDCKFRILIQLEASINLTSLSKGKGTNIPYNNHPGIGNFSQTCELKLKN